MSPTSPASLPTSNGPRSPRSAPRPHRARSASPSTSSTVDVISSLYAAAGPRTGPSPRGAPRRRREEGVDGDGHDQGRQPSRAASSLQPATQGVGRDGQDKRQEHRTEQAGDAAHAGDRDRDRACPAAPPATRQQDREGLLVGHCSSFLRGRARVRRLVATVETRAATKTTSNTSCRMTRATGDLARSVDVAISDGGEGRHREVERVCPRRDAGELAGAVLVEHVVAECEHHGHEDEEHEQRVDVSSSLRTICRLIWPTIAQPSNATPRRLISTEKRPRGGRLLRVDGNRVEDDHHPEGAQHQRGARPVPGEAGVTLAVIGPSPLTGREWVRWPSRTSIETQHRAAPRRRGSPGPARAGGSAR